MKRIVLLSVLLAACAGNPDNVPTHSDCAADRDCDDSIACTVDRCVPTVNGFLRCDNTPDDDLCPSGLICMLESVLGSGCQDPLELACADAGEGDPCEPPDRCATSKGVCTSGLCVFERLQCPDRPCLTTEGCDPATGICRYTMAEPDAACDADGDRCTNDRCSGGACTQGVDTCECSESRPCVQPANLCLGSAACVEGKCVSDPVDCMPFNTGCLFHYCVPATGLCEPLVINDGGPCSDDLACTGPGVCDGGACIAGSLECPQRACNTVKCVEPSGCRYTPAQGACDDLNPCNGPDECDEGSCQPVGEGISCDDGNPCTADECIPSNGLCRHAPINDCCGNSVIEPGEQCDSISLPGTGCQACEYTVVSLDYAGSSPRFAWSPTLGAGLVTWEVVNEGGGHGVSVRTLSALGAFGPTLPVPAGTVSGRSMSPGVVATDSAFILGALTASSPEFWLLDSTGRPRIRTAVQNPYYGGAPTGRMVMAWSELRSVAAWVVAGNDGSQQLLYADLASGVDQLLVSGPALLHGTEGAGEILPGDACPVADGVVVTFAVRSENLSSSIVTQKAAYFRAGTSEVTVWDLAASEWDQSYPTSCAPAPSGFLAVHTRLERSPLMRIVVEGTFVDLVDGPGVPFEVESISGDEGAQVMPFSSDLVASGDDGFLFLCPLVEPRISAPERVSPAVMLISGDGQVLSGPTPLEGPALDFAAGIAAGMASESTMSVFWVETAEISQIYGGGQVAGRLYPAPGI